MAAPSDLPLILAAMQASMSSATSKEQRTQAEALLAQLKESQICMELMLHILSVESEAHNDFIRLLSLTILSDWVKMWWNKINENDQTIVKNSVLTLLHGAIGRSPMRGLRTKLAVMISNIAVRSFPQLWSSFLEDMAGIVISTGTSNTIEQKEIAFMAIEFTSADAIDSDYCAAIPIERRQDILGGYRTKLPQLLSFSCQFLMQCSNEFVTGMQEIAAARSGVSGSSGSGGSGMYGSNAMTGIHGNGQVHGKVLASLITCILRMVQSLAMFAKPEDICDATANRDFSMLALQFLSIIPTAGSGGDYTELVWELQVEAVNLIHTITAQKLPADIFARLIEAIPRHVPQAATTYTGGVGSGVDIDDDIDITEQLAFLRTYAETVFALLSENIALATGRNYLQSSAPDGQAQQLLGVYVMLMANLNAQPSRRLASDVIKDWIKIFKDESIANLPWMGEVCTAVLRVYTEKLYRVVWEKPESFGNYTGSIRSGMDGTGIGMGLQQPSIWSPVPVDPSAATEFDEFEDWVEFYGALKSQLRSLTQVCAVRFPVVCAHFLVERVQLLFPLDPLSTTSSSSSANHGNHGRNKTTTRGGGMTDSEAVIAWQAYALMLDALLPRLEEVAIKLSSSSSSSSSPSSLSLLALSEQQQQDGCVDTINTCLQSIVSALLTWTPLGGPNSPLLIQRLQCLQNCSPALKIHATNTSESSPTHHQQQQQQIQQQKLSLLQQLLSDLFRYDCDFDMSSATLEVLPFAFQLQLKEKAAAVMAHLCCNCGTTLTSDGTLLEAVITRITSMITRTLTPPTIMPSIQSGLSPTSQHILMRGGGNFTGCGSTPVVSARQSLQNQRACLREALVAISESIFNSSTTAATTATATSLLVLSLQDVVNTWQELATPPTSATEGPVIVGPKSICHSPQALLDACYHAAAADLTTSTTSTDDATRGGGHSSFSSIPSTPLHEGGGVGGVYSTNQEVMVLHSVGAAKDALGVILSSARRVTHRTLPDHIWTCVQDSTTSSALSSSASSSAFRQQPSNPAATLTTALEQALPFIAVWHAILPGIRVALRSIHEVGSPALRLELSQSPHTAGLYLPALISVRRAAGLPAYPSDDHPTPIIHPGTTAPGFGLSTGLGTGLDINGQPFSMTTTQASIGSTNPSGISFQQIAKHMGELRMVLYQLLGQACSHKVLYAHPDHAAVVTELSNALPYLENTQLSQLMKIFVEAYVMNAPPVGSLVILDTVAGFLEAFLRTTFHRLSLCWQPSVESLHSDLSPPPSLATPSFHHQSNPSSMTTTMGGSGVSMGISSLGVTSLGGENSNEAMLCRFIYQQCSIPPSYAGMENEALDNARKSICAELTRTYGDTLASFACVRGYLSADMPTTAAGFSATMLGINCSSAGTYHATSGGGSTEEKEETIGMILGSPNSTNKKAGKAEKSKKGKKPFVRVKDGDEESESVVPPAVTDGGDAWLRHHKAARRNVLHTLFMADPRYQKAVTEPFVASAVALIGLPDSTAMRRGLSLAEYLIHQCAGPTGDRRLVLALGRDAFSAALCVLLQQETWSEGMEWEIVDFLTLIYGTLVLGETRASDGAVIPHGAPLSGSGGGVVGDKHVSGGMKPSGGGRTGGLKQSNNNNNNGGQKGFGNMTSWQSGNGGGNGGGKGNNRNTGSASSSSMNGGSGGDGSNICIYSDLPRQVLLMIPQTLHQSTTSVVTSIAPLVEHFERQLSTQLSKKKRREHLKDFLKAAASGSENNGSGQATKGTRSVLDIRKRMTVRFAPQTKAGSGLGSDAYGDLDLSSFFGD